MEINPENLNEDDMIRNLKTMLKIVAIFEEDIFNCNTADYKKFTDVYYIFIKLIATFIPVIESRTDYTKKELLDAFIKFLKLEFKRVK